MPIRDAEWQAEGWKRATKSRLGRRRALGLAAACAGGAFLAACGSRQGKKPQTASTNRGTSAGQPKSGGTVLGRVAHDPTDWDVTYQGFGLPNSAGLQVAYDRLLNYKSGPNVPYNELTLQPMLAERWETPDGQTYTFHLRQGVKFANLPPVNGRSFSSSDVKWSIEYLSRGGQFQGKKLPTAYAAWMFEGLSDVQTPDASTVVLRFAQPFVPFLHYVGFTWNVMLPHEIFDQDGDFKNRIAGTGPYQLDMAASQRGSRWVWKRNPGYWDAPRPYIDEIDWLVIPDDSTAYAAFQTKQVDILTGTGAKPTAQDIEQIKRGRPDAVIDQYLSTGPLLFYLHVSAPPFNDLRLRQALSLGVDRDEFVRTFTGGKGGWALAGAFSDTFTQAEIKQLVHYDPAQAKNLVAAAGYPQGVDIEFTYPGAFYGNIYIQEMQLLQAQLRKVGINLALKNLDKQDWVDRLVKHQYTLTFINKAGQPDIDSVLYAQYYPGSKYNYADVNDPVLTPLLELQRREIDPAKRQQTIREAVKRINVDQAWALGVFYPDSYDVWSPRLQNYGTTFGIAGWPLTSSWLAS